MPSLVNHKRQQPVVTTYWFQAVPHIHKNPIHTTTSKIYVYFTYANTNYSFLFITLARGIGFRFVPFYFVSFCSLYSFPGCSFVDGQCSFEHSQDRRLFAMMTEKSVAPIYS